jgi:heme A synthase
MFEGCVTVLYGGTTILFAVVFLTASLAGCRSVLQPLDSLWKLLLAVACVVYLGSMLATLAGTGACKVWPGQTENRKK